MAKPKLILYSREIAHCSCYDAIFNSEFDPEVTDSEGSFLDKIANPEADAAVICLCSAREEDVPEFLRLQALSRAVPVLICSKSLNSDFIDRAASKGVSRFLACDMAREDIRDIVFNAIKRGGLKEFLERSCPGSLDSSLHISKMIDIIVHTFPQRLSESEIAQRLGISRRWLQRLCRQAFGKTFSRLMRYIRIHQALQLMRHTTLDNADIALQLNYSESSHLARDFRSELGYTPHEARSRLASKNPEELLCGR